MCDSEERVNVVSYKGAHKGAHNVRGDEDALSKSAKKGMKFLLMNFLHVLVDPGSVDLRSDVPSSVVSGLSLAE